VNDYYGKPIPKDEIISLKGEVDDSIYALYTKMLDHIYLLENKLALLERRNRELRGQLGKVG
jgi:DNA polymerase IIIc chi subunit